MLSRGNLSQLVIDTLKLFGKPVGDATTPEDQYGWTGQPDSPGSMFIPYLIVTPGTVSDIKGPLADTHADAKIPYQITGFGVSRQQCEWMMDGVREQLDILADRTIECGDGRYKIVTVEVTTIGGIARGNIGDYEVFGQSDILTLFLSKELFQ
jgi:hypothetical protein